MDVYVILKFLGLYLLLNIIQFFITFLSNIFDLIAAIISVKLMELQAKLNGEEENTKKENINCIGFQISNNEIEEESSEDE